MATVLFVDDQLEFRAMHTAYLQHHGFRVLTADDGDSALALARAEHPDIIVLDHSLPRRTGVEVAREIHADPTMNGVPIVMLTALSFGAIGKRAQAAGCAAFLSKPCSPGRLLQEVLRLVRSAGTPQ